MIFSRQQVDNQVNKKPTRKYESDKRNKRIEQEREIRQRLRVMKGILQISQRKTIESFQLTNPPSSFFFFFSNFPAPFFFFFFFELSTQIVNKN